ncbi:MAG TPA: ABC transporter permease [Candidatus Thermoplasmatota archaeon]|nr:ABC transporter permease [Candidatus Thermoplasmatota archaeon]
MKLVTYIARRLLLLLPVLVGISLVTFGLAWFATGGHLENQYLDQQDRTRPEQIERIVRQHGFDKPAYVQYFIYVKNFVTGDMGISTSFGSRPVSDVIALKFPASAELALVAILFAVVLGIPLGILSATRRDTPWDHVTRFVALSGVSVPVFWLALILQLVFAYKLDLFPLINRFDANLLATHPVLIPDHQQACAVAAALGQSCRIQTGILLFDTLVWLDFVAFWDVLKHLMLPAFTLGFVSLGIITRMMRASMLEVLGNDYVRTARAKGLEERVVINRHARRNALIPTTTVIGLSIGGLMGGAVLTETIFAWPGLGEWAASAILSIDVAAIMGFVALTAVVYVTVNLLVDILYAYLDPRVRLE